MEHPYLEWIDEHQQSHRKKIIDRICMGRTCKGIDPGKRILLKLPLISRDHAEINWTGAYLQITDTSRNGTWVNDVRMTAGSTKVLSDGDTIRIGYSVFRVICPQIVPSDQIGRSFTDLTVVSPLEAEVTSLVADLRGFSAFCQTHASANVYGMINVIFDRFSKIIEEFKGTVKDYAGDSILAFWEHQFGDPARQSVLACRAATRQMQSFHQIRIDLSAQYADVEGLRMGWGITTGPVTLAHYGARTADLAMVGDCVNLASRLCGMANKDIAEPILICAQTAKLVKKDLELRDLGMHPIQGRQGREHIFALHPDI